MDGVNFNALGHLRTGGGGDTGRAGSDAEMHASGGNRGVTVCSRSYLHAALLCRRLSLAAALLFLLLCLSVGDSGVCRW